MLDIISGACWSIVYITAIVLGFKNKTWCIPKLAICQNFAWELWIVLEQISNHSLYTVAFVIQLAWLVLDVGVLVTLFVYDRGKPSSVFDNIILLGVVLIVMFALTIVAEKWEYIAFIINAIMSIAFVVRFYKHSGNWTSIAVSFFKMIGTGAATILNGIIVHQPLITWLGGLCLIFDAYYLYLVFMKKRRKKEKHAKI